MKAAKGVVPLGDKTIGAVEACNGGQRALWIVVDGIICKRDGEGKGGKKGKGPNNI
jgi:hypothetical protein